VPLTVEIVTAERILRREEGVDVLIAPGTEGQLAILPHHAPLMTTLDFGVLEMRRGGNSEFFAVSGGFMEVRNDRVVILADAAESAADIDIERAEAARARARQRLDVRMREGATSGIDDLRARAALLRSLARLRAAERIGRQRRTGAPPRT
jgi:F-type H+-transporting ATPase subunit epsilon